MAYLATHTIPPGSGAPRVSDYILTSLPYFSSRKSIQKAIKRREILVDDNPVEGDHAVSEGSTIKILESQIQQKILELEIPVVYEDDYIAIVDKPAGLTVSGNSFKTLKNCLPFNLKRSSQIDKLKYPLPAHRIDRQTSGLVLVGKTRKAIHSLNLLFEHKEVNKYYLTLVSGEVVKPDKIELKIDGKPAKTVYTILDLYNSSKKGTYSLLEVIPETGRTHQIRKHLHAIGHPVVGDNIYKGDNKNKIKGLFLRAYRLAFIHPITKEYIDIKLEHSRKFEKFINRIQKL